MKVFLVSLSLDWKEKYDELEKFSSIPYVRESQDASSLACAAAGAITYHSFHHKGLVKPENKIDKDLNS